MLYATDITISRRYMEYFGIVHCNDGYYAGWDGKGEASEEACKNLCMREGLCTFVAYLNMGNRKTCSRYNKDTCNLDANVKYNERNHTTFEKRDYLL